MTSGIPEGLYAIINAEKRNCARSGFEGLGFPLRALLLTNYRVKYVFENRKSNQINNSDDKHCAPMCISI